MRRVFVDTSFWIALLNARDRGHEPARTAAEAVRGATLVTTDEVLSEVLTFFSGFGPAARRAAGEFVDRLLADSDIVVFEQSRSSLLDGLGLYRARADKAYSLVDCTSMNRMRSEGIAEVLTRDDHFKQEGFTILS